uniref:HAT C-terminal dimerisation domain-containing protein n=1 Tax=Romanomermis culicivorax TaxID=13658 RepID=A0A915KX02_ROMCU
WFRYEANFTAAVGQLKALVEVKLADRLNNEVDEPDTTAAQSSTEACVTEKKLYWAKCMEIIKINENAQSVADPITIKNESNCQINAYLVEETIDPDSDPLKFWQLKQKTYPQLATIAKQYLAAHLSSVASEREFKIGKRMISNTWFRLLPKNVEKLIWYYYNNRAINGKIESVIQEYESQIVSDN